MAQKSASEKTVATIFTIPAKIKAALYQKVPNGNRSRFVAETLAAKLGVSLTPVAKKIAKKKSVAKKVVKKIAAKKVTAPKNKGLFGMFK